MISLFDLDQTLLSKNGSYAFGCYLFKKRLISISTMLYCAGCYGLHKLGKLSLHATHKKIFDKLFLGRSKHAFSKVAHDFVNKNISQMLYEPALKKLREGQLRGHHIVLISSSPSFLVKLIAVHFGIDEYYATEYQIDTEGKFVSIDKVLDGEGKAQFLRDIIRKRGIAPENTIAYTDSHLDLPFLIQAGHRVGVNPDSKLRLICKQRGWDII